MKAVFPWLGWPLALLLFLAWLDARDAVSEERGACNVEKVQTELDAANAKLAATEKAHEDERKQWLEIIEDTRQAIEIANDARILAESRPPEVRRVVERIADEDACMRAVVPADALSSLYSAESNHTD